jgi:pimeloyl-ACP methyl ester carboxylesterase
VITLDLLGHGHSDRPRDMWRYSMSAYGDEVVALMDHLGIDQAVVMGTSLGANAALETVASHPDRVRGLVIEMPVLDNGLLGSALAFTPLLVALTFGEPLMKVLARVTRAIPRRILPHYGNVALDVVRQDPGPSGALMQGLFFGRIAPPRSERRSFTAPTLVLGHSRDPVHPFSDAGMLAREMPNARLLMADSLVELRLRPERLTNEIADFLDDVWAARSPRRKRARAAASPNGGAGTVPVRSRSRGRASAASPRTRPQPG